MKLDRFCRALLMACFAFAAPTVTAFSTAALVAGVSLSLLSSQVQAEDLSYDTDESFDTAVSTSGNVTISSATVTFADGLTADGYLKLEGSGTTGSHVIFGGDSTIDYFQHPKGSNNYCSISLLDNASLTYANAGNYAYYNHISYILGDASELTINHAYCRVGGSSTSQFKNDANGNGGTVNFAGGLIIGADSSGGNVFIDSAVTAVADSYFGIGYTGTMNSSRVANLNLKGTFYNNADTIVIGTNTQMTSAINILDGGNLVLKNGLTATGSADNQLSIYADGTLSLGQEIGADGYQDLVAVHVFNGATIAENGVADVTTVYTEMLFGTYDSMSYTDNGLDGTIGKTSLVSGDVASVNFSAGQDKTLKMASNIASATEGVSLDANIQGAGTVEFAGQAVLNQIDIAQGATLAVSGSVSAASVAVSGTVTIDDAGQLDTSNISMNSAGASLTGGSFDAATVSISSATSAGSARFVGTRFNGATSINLANAAQLSLDSVVLGAGTRFIDGGNGSIQIAGATVINAEAAALGVSTAAASGNIVETYTINTFSSLTDTTSLSIGGTLVINLILSSDEFALLEAYWANGDLFNVVLAFGDASLSSSLSAGDVLVKVFEEGSTSTIYTVSSSIAGGGVTTDGSGNLVITVPEPSTATLSLMALTALLARRKRRAALR